MTLPESLTGFLEAVAAATPTPGGGAAAAVTAALAAALAAMGARLALPHAAEDRRDGLEELIRTGEGLRGRLLELAERDVRAFTAVLQASRLEDGTEADRAARRMTAWREATRVPAEVVRACRDVTLLARRAAREGLPAAQGDALMAALLATAAAAGSQVNLRLNLQAAGRPEDLRVLADQTEVLLREAQRAAAETRLLLEQRLTGAR